MIFFFNQNFDTLCSKYAKRKNRINQWLEALKQTAPAQYSKFSSIAEELETACKSYTSGNFSPEEEAVMFEKAKKNYKILRSETLTVMEEAGEFILYVLLPVTLGKMFLYNFYFIPSGSAEPHLLIGDFIWGSKISYLWSPVKRGDYVFFPNPSFKYAKKGSLKYYWQKHIGISIPPLGLPKGPDFWLKRVIGLPGDKIEGIIEDGKPIVKINGKVIHEPYLNPYPLVAARRDVGFISKKIPFAEKLLPHWLIRKPGKISYYTYDPAKSLYDQPFYAFDDYEIIKNSHTEKPLLKYPEEADWYDEYTLTVPKDHYFCMGDNRRNSGDCRVWGTLPKEFITGKALLVILSIDTESSFYLLFGGLVEIFRHPIEFWTRRIRWNRFFKTIPHEIKEGKEFIS